MEKEKRKSTEEIKKFILNNCVKGKLKPIPNRNVELYDVEGDVIIEGIEIERLPLLLKFNKVSGNFICTNNKLTILSGFPQEIGGSLIVSHNQLWIFRHRDFDTQQHIASCPVIIKGNFDCSNNKITSLGGCPEVVHGIFDCSNNKIDFFENAIKKVDKLYCFGNPIKDFKEVPIMNEIICSDCKLRTEIIEEIKAKYKEIAEPLPIIRFKN